uniref:phosphatidate phosphatase n=1 Tax=Neogobius melanostomus TaxID=47308 RepID=A0A8C6TW50_9GOBI
MNYVGQLAGQVFVQVKELYRGLNPATLSGCIDVIVVRQPDGTLQCSPFTSASEKWVDIEINGESVALHMKLGDNGEAFFVQEMEDNQEVVPSYLATSPILSDGAVLMSSSLLGKSSGPPVQTLGAAGTNGEPGSGVMKKRRKRRRKARSDSVKREESGEYSGGEDMFTIDISSDETEMEASVCLGKFPRRRRREVHRIILLNRVARMGNGARCKSKIFNCHLQQTLKDLLPTRSCFSLSPGGSRPTSPKSDSELMKQSDADNENPQMHWAWGELPQAATPSFLPVKPEPSPLNPVSILVSESTHFRVISREPNTEPCEPYTQMPALTLIIPEEAARATEGMETQAEEAQADSPTGVNMAAQMMMDLDEGAPHVPSKMDSPSKKKEKRSRHLGSDGIYLDDITELEPEVAALYFPKSDGGAGARSEVNPSLHDASLSPQSLSSGGDSGVDTYCDHIADLPSMAISLCGGLTDNWEITNKQFHAKIISYQQFAQNPSIIDDPNLVVKVGSKYYNWSTAAPLMLAMQAFQKPLPKATVENIMKKKMPKKGGRWWFSWRGRNSNSKSVITTFFLRILWLKEESSSSDDEQRVTSSVQSDVGPAPGGVSYKKTLRLTSEQLMSLQLRDGPNDVVFSVTTQYQGTCRCQGTIYLWNWDDKIVISDIDGTITRSDTLGHILPTLGKDWTHQGIAHLYHKVSQNGYKFLYCSARAIGMADMTRGYLNWVNERGTMLPMGPVLLSPSSLFSALHRSVIEKKPEKFKVECLNDIKHLFHPNTEPFYAAFGNRPTDVFSYKEVGVPLNRIFTVNPKGELVQEHAKTNISSYVRLGEVVDHVFPLKARSSSSDFPLSDTFSHFTFWRENLPPVDHHRIAPSQISPSS